jgi:hypothetical protein
VVSQLNDRIQPVVATDIREGYSNMLPITMKNTTIHILLQTVVVYFGARGSVVIEAPSYKPEGNGFETR